MLLSYDEVGSPHNRMLLVLKWFLSTIQDEQYSKKPYNPILGETHHCFVESQKYGKIQFIAEQVSHHPPTSAICFYSEKKPVQLYGASDFLIKWNGNKVHAVTNGGSLLKLNNETYEISRIVPDMYMKNILVGSVRFEWVGEIRITCRETGLSAFVQFEKENHLKGCLMDAMQKALLTFAGNTGGLIQITDFNNRSIETLIDFRTLQRSQIRYYNVPQEENESLIVWKKLTNAIVENQIDLAEQEKAQIERIQREGQQKPSKYFERNTSGQWFPKW